MSKILLDTARGGYPCWGCEKVFGPNEVQTVLGDEDAIWAICPECRANGVVRLW